MHTLATRPRPVPEALGDAAFRREHGVRLAYVAGSMYRAISSVEMVVRLGRAGLLGFFGTGGLKPPQVEEAIRRIRAALPPGAPQGMNLLHDEIHPEREADVMQLFLRTGVDRLEASAFTYVTAPLVRYRAAGLRRDAAGRVVPANRILAKLSRPEVATAFLDPAPAELVCELVGSGGLSTTEAELLAEVPMADDICVEADSGGHTDGASALALFPTMLRLRDRAMARHGYARRVRMGAAGGIGTPEAAATAFLMGFDFVLTGSINQCTVEAGTSAAVKEMLQQADIQDCTYAPAGDLFETGAKVQVLRRGLLFPARANRLYQLYNHYDGIDDLPPGIRQELETRVFRRGLDQIFDHIRTRHAPEYIRRVEANPRHKMAMIFRSYLGLSTKFAMEGDPERRADYQIHCGPAMGAFNQWVKGTDLEPWQARHVDVIAERLMCATADTLSRQMASLAGGMAG